MNCGSKRWTPLLLALVLGAMTLPLRHVFGEETAKPAAPAQPTLEAQIEYLEGALSEALRVQDWKMLEMACTGYKASGLKGTDLELSLTRAERDAALDALRAYTGLGVGNITSFGLAARSKLGDAAAHSKLYVWGFDEIPEVKAPDQQLYASQPTEADKQMKAFQVYQQKRTQQEFALLTLALLREPGVLDRAIALAGTRQSPINGVYYMGGNSMGDTLVLAALAVDPDQGLKKLMVLAADEKVETYVQIRILSALVQLKAFSNNAMVGDTKFTVGNEMGATLPQEFMKEVAKPYVALLKRYTPAPRRLRVLT